MTTWYVCEYLHKEGRRAEARAVIHLGDCLWCRHGQGHRQNAGMKLGLVRWHGPFDSLPAPRAHAAGITEPVACKRCRPF